MGYVVHVHPERVALVSAALERVIGQVEASGGLLSRAWLLAAGGAGGGDLDGAARSLGRSCAGALEEVVGAGLSLSRATAAAAADYARVEAELATVWGSIHPAARGGRP
ncbi:hypothetical protein ACQBAT_10065 [Ornithinimicrobium sp. Y1847]|uniref:hypothetical protein n=1 Tax=Ornithinimicrobium sp. Y1847 TaxID=3405419 RepID=UPI003B66EDF9